ncbi:MAG: sodium-independent anion transporter [Gammaproteobacteria bacterium]
MASSVEVLLLSEEQLRGEFVDKGEWRLPPNGLVYSIDGPFFFGAVENFERALAQTHTDPRWLIIRLDQVPFMDITGLQTLEEVIRNLRKRGIIVLLTEANARVHGKLEKAGILHQLGSKRYFADFAQAVLEINSTLAVDVS